METMNIEENQGQTVPEENRHKTHENVNKCEICHKIFNEKNRLTHHIDLVHGDGVKKKHKCNICNMLFYHKGGVAKHIDIVHVGVAKK